MTFLDRLLSYFPWLKDFLLGLDRYLGPVFAILIALLIIGAFYWSFSVVPKRIQRSFHKLSKRGYAADDLADPRLPDIVETLAPIYRHHPKKGRPIPPWKAITSVSTSCRGGRRYLLYTARLQIEWSAPGKTNSLRHCVMLLENRKLDFAEAVYLLPSHYVEGENCDERYNLQKVSPEKRSPFFDHYACFTKSGSLKAFPEPLRKALTMLAPLFILQDSQTIHIWGASLKFCREGWGLLSSEEIYKSESLDKFIEAANLISNSL